MSERVLSQRELNRALLARQLLLRRARLSVPRAIERIGAIQAQAPAAPYIALWSRLEGFRREQLMRALEHRSVVKATLMRKTLHHVSAHDYLAYAGLLRDARQVEMKRRAERDGLPSDVRRLARRIENLGEPRTRPELLELLGLPKLRTDQPQQWVVWYLLVGEADLVHTPESSVWRRNTAGARFSPSTAWLGRRPGADAEQLVRRYLAAFGPATRADLLRWTGQTVRTLGDSLDRLKLRRFRDERGRPLLDLPRAPLPDASTEAPVRFLPVWDSTLLAHDDRTRILPEEYRKLVILPGGDVLPTFLVDGVVAGLWRYEDGKVRLEPFAPVPRRVRRELDDEARRLARVHP